MFLWPYQFWWGSVKKLVDSSLSTMLTDRRIALTCSTCANISGPWQSQWQIHDHYMVKAKNSTSIRLTNFSWHSLLNKNRKKNQCVDHLILLHAQTYLKNSRVNPSSSMASSSRIAHLVSCRKTFVCRLCTPQMLQPLNVLRQDVDAHLQSWVTAMP